MTEWQEREIKLEGQFWNPVYRPSPEPAISGREGDWLEGVCTARRATANKKNLEKTDYYFEFKEVAAVLKGEPVTYDSSKPVLFRLSQANQALAKEINVGMKIRLIFQGLKNTGKPNPMPIYRYFIDPNYSPERTPF